MSARGVVVGVAVLVVLGGAVVADRFAVGMAQDVAVDGLRANVQGVTGDPKIVITGFPFLTQLLAGELTDVTGRVEGLTFKGVQITDVDVDAEGVTTHRPYTVHRALLTGSLSTATVEQLLAAKADLHVHLTVDGDRLKATTQLLGSDLTATLVPRAEHGAIRVKVADVTLGGVKVDVAALPSGIAKRFNDMAVPVEGLPDGVVVTGVAVRDGGVRITATGTDVTLAAP
ncbi:DUF2993 domain-containing protein [Pengzhenrongella sp.]|uniref:LmeA family phospholipid-binding protein n=1 Tax=Pengzhenrongella sp. TaxID=2888820 RepID=UPI002F937F2F